jgi:hypothetical protein
LLLALLGAFARGGLAKTELGAIPESELRDDPLDVDAESWELGVVKRVQLSDSMDDES